MSQVKNKLMNDDVAGNHPQSETNTTVSAASALNVAPNGSERRESAGKFRAMLPFFRMILWVLVYATAALFLISLILLGGFRFQT